MVLTVFFWTNESINVRKPDRAELGHLSPVRPAARATGGGGNEAAGREAEAQTRPTLWTPSLLHETEVNVHLLRTVPHS